MTLRDLEAEFGERLRVTLDAVIPVLERTVATDRDTEGVATGVESGMVDVRQPARTSRVRWVLAAAASVLVVVGVGALGILASREGHEPPKVPPDDSSLPSEYPVDHELRSQALGGPLEDLGRYPKEAWQAAIATCMSERGFTYRPGTYGGGRDPQVLNPLNRAAAQVYGYHFPPDHDPGASTTGSDEFERALAGDDPSLPVPVTDPPLTAQDGSYGCGGIAWAQTIGRFEEQMKSVGQLSASFEAALAGYLVTPDGVARTQQWAACMEGLGYDFVDQAEPRDMYVGDSSISDEEIEVRLDDIGCDEQAGLTAARSQFQQARVDEWLAANVVAVQELQVLADTVKRELGS